jgi:hypothetical protein
MKHEYGSKWIEVRTVLEGHGFFARRRIQRHWEGVRRTYAFNSRNGSFRIFTEYLTISDPGHTFGNRKREFRIMFEVAEPTFPEFRLSDDWDRIFVEQPVKWVAIEEVAEIKEPHAVVA